MKTCLNVNCPERFSLCCGAGCTNGEGDEEAFVCRKCRRKFFGGACTASTGKSTIKNLLSEVYAGVYGTKNRAKLISTLESVLIKERE
mgnify:CR=1 FL=1